MVLARNLIIGLLGCWLGLALPVRAQSDERLTQEKKGAIFSWAIRHFGEPTNCKVDPPPGASGDSLSMVCTFAAGLVYRSYTDEISTSQELTWATSQPATPEHLDLLKRALSNGKDCTVDWAHPDILPKDADGLVMKRYFCPDTNMQVYLDVDQAGKVKRLGYRWAD